MRLNWKKYAFEIIAIFIGITISFVFENWKNNLEKKQSSKIYISNIQNDLTRTVNWIAAIDTTLEYTYTVLMKFENGEAVDLYQLGEAMDNMSESTIDIQIKSLLPNLHRIQDFEGVKSNDLIYDIQTALTYINSLAENDADLCVFISNYFANQLYQSPLIAEALWFYNTTESGSFSKKVTTNSSPEIIPKVQIMIIKLNHLLKCHNALSNQINILNNQLKELKSNL